MSNQGILNALTPAQEQVLDSFDLARYVWLNNQPLNEQLVTNIQTLNVEYTMDQVSQITINMEDPNLVFSNAGFFNLRTPVQFFFSRFEITVLSYGPGASKNEQVTLLCRPRGAQIMKRSKGELVRRNISPTQFMFLEAQAAGMGFVGQPSASVAQVSRTASSNTDESSWDVGNTLAGNLGYIMFESENILYFGQPTWLVGQMGTPISLTYPSNATDKLTIQEFPTATRSDDDANGSTVTINVDRQGRARQIRPGMTMQVHGIAPFSSETYLVSSVNWTEYDIGPVVIEMRSPVNPIVPQPPKKDTSVSGSSKGQTVLNIVDQTGVQSQKTANDIEGLGV